MKVLFLIIVIIGFLNVYLLNSVKSEDREYVCSHHPEKEENMITGIHIDDIEPGSRRKRATPTNFRIYFHYMPSIKDDADFVNLRDKIMIPAKELLQKSIRPKIPVTGILRVDRQCESNQFRGVNGKRACATGCTSSTVCLGTTVPEMFLNKCKVMDSRGVITESGTAGAGVTDNDLIILVERKSCNTGVLAWAGSCFLEEKLDRPILGVINVCSNGIQVKSDNEKNVKTITHELIHVLGFSVSLYAFFRDRSGNPYVPRNQLGWPSLGVNSAGYYNFNNKIAKLVDRQRSSKNGVYTRTGYAFTLPTVVAEAKHHFQCSTLDSVDLEDSGGSGSSSSHFDEYGFHDEIMSPVIYKVEYLSRLTLALLYDTGWYDVNGCEAEPLKYGLGAGCKFALAGCYAYMKEESAGKRSIAPFCNRLLTYGDVFTCSDNSKNYKYCNLRTHSSLDTKYQYFDVSTYGGNTVWMEFCPIYLQHSCENDNKGFATGASMYIGKDSKCFKNNIGAGQSSRISGSTCFKTTCNSNSYSFQVGSSTYTCSSSETIKHSGSTIQCEPFSVVCPAKTTKSCPNWVLGDPPPVTQKGGLNNGNVASITQILSTTPTVTGPEVKKSLTSESSTNSTTTTKLETPLTSSEMSSTSTSTSSEMKLYLIFACLFGVASICRV